MHIRPLKQNDQIHVENIMAEHSLQFPKFIIAQYPQRWKTFLELQDQKSSSYNVSLNDTNEVIGHAGYIFNVKLDLYEIVGVVVSQTYQRKGTGKILIDRICNDISKLGITRVILFTLGHVGNEAALLFYRNLGFEITNYEKDYFTKDYDRVTFLRDL